MCVFFRCCWGFVISALCEDRPKIIQEVSPTIERNLGENATLYCKVDNPGDFTVSWVKLNRDNPSDQTVLSYNHNLVVKGRLNVFASGNTFTLEVIFSLALISIFAS